MKFVLDENIPLSLINFLKSNNHQVIHIRETALKGSSDKKIAEFTKKQKAILITKDLEFGNIHLHKKGSHYGLIIIRLPYYFTAKRIIDNLSKLFENLDLNELVDSIMILELGKYRIRKL